MASILAPSAIRQKPAGQIGQPGRVVEQAAVGGDATAVEFQLQAPVEIEPSPNSPVGWSMHRPSVRLNVLIIMEDSDKPTVVHPRNAV